MTDVVRTPEQEAAYLRLITARFREAHRMNDAVNAYLVATADLPFEARRELGRRKEYVTPYFLHLAGIERAMVVFHAGLRINDILWAAERERQETEDA
ncbi:hypothetical protein GFL58_30975 [Rhizobium leguminosarum bv. viciae]|uniref:hypothetical protein n=1 Tax=Rhizobium leguminosarum TaxID=384 RepID=UPI00143FB0C6|nr:hypothetical protein [Rhizobium leguminosarum]NKM65342.1 hypothetical protein [Rhizobium leguminosarum bv. viciae]